MDPLALLPHIPGLRRYARALTGDAWAADDLVQDTLERACSKWRFWQAGTDLRAWLFTLMHNIQANQWRSARHERQAGPPVDLEDVQHELLAPPSAMEAGIDLQRCLLRLPPEQREVLLLVGLEGLSYDAVARITGVPVGTVMSRLSRARQRLQQLMGGEPAAKEADHPAVVVSLRHFK
jgi:RNA polymerase sigma factor (sigma-70 family)